MVAPVHSFAAASNIGTWAEERIADYYRGLQHHVEHLSANPFFQAFDIDLRVIDLTERVWYVEVKGDSYRRRGNKLNIYVETLANVEKGTKGCLLYTCADYIAYYFVHEGFALMIPVAAFHAWATDENLLRFPLKTVSNGNQGVVKYTSQGRPVPVDVIRAEVEGTYTVAGLPTMGVSTKSDRGNDISPERGK